MMMIKQEIQRQSSKIMFHLNHAYKKSITHLQAVQKILILLCQCKCVRIQSQLFYEITKFNTDKVNDSAIENNPAGNKTKNDKNNK